MSQLSALVGSVLQHCRHCCVPLLQNPFGVAIGATAGHAAATALAVAGGALAGKYISEKTVNYISGVLFLLFAAATVYTMM